MKANIHPEMNTVSVKCACGANFETKSTKSDIQIEVCDKCHPFYTGSQGNMKKTGAVERFNRKFGFNEEAKTTEEK